MKRLLIAILLSASTYFHLFSGQQPESDTLYLSLQEAIELAQKQSLDILAARHSFRSSYWNYCYYKANYYPSLTFSSTPNFNHSINTITLPDGTSQFIPQNQLTTNAVFTLNQNIPFTGGNLFLQTSLTRLDILDDDAHFYKSTPLLIGYQQSLFGYNQLKWDQKIEPIRYESAKKKYVEALESVGYQTIVRFFNLASAQTNLTISEINFANADTLYRFARGRYEIGTITENDMLQLEISKLSEENNRLNEQLNAASCMQDLRSYLGIKENRPVVVVIEKSIPVSFIPTAEALSHALTSSSDMLYLEELRLMSESEVAFAKSERGIKADLYMQFGLEQTSTEIEAVYRSPRSQQHIEVGIRLPILDWGRGKGRVQVAKSKRDMVMAEIEQTQNNFEMNIIRYINQFNLKSKQLKVVEQMDETANKRSEVARRLYLLGKSNLLDLNASIAEKDMAKRNYINTLCSYWTLYYTIRRYTLYDFEQNIPITEDYNLLLK